MSKNRLIFIILSGFLFFLDLILKNFFSSHPEKKFLILKEYLKLQFFPNPGIAFSIPFPNIILILLTPLVLVLLIYLLIKSLGNKKRWFVPVGLTLIILGALSNYLDRLFQGVTIDYLHLYNSVINIADIQIFLGALLLLVKQKK